MKEEDRDMNHTIYTTLESNSYENLMPMEVFENIMQVIGPSDGLSPGVGLEDDTLDAADATVFISDAQPTAPLQPENYEYLPLCRRGPPERTVCPGSLNFQVEINAADTHRKKYLYSNKLNCIYVNMKTCFSVQFRWDTEHASRPMYVRATTVFADHAQAEKRVERCTQHIHDPGNANLSENIIRNVLHSGREMSTAGVYYCGDPSLADSWYSVVVEFAGAQEPYSHAYQFGCKNSCTSGINRRATAIIFELEDSRGVVFGRQVVNARSCACPRRDMVRDEECATPPSATKRPVKKDAQKNDTNKKIKLEVITADADDVITLPSVEIVGVRTVIAGLSTMLALMEYEASQSTDPQTAEKYNARITALKTQIEHYKTMKTS